MRSLVGPVKYSGDAQVSNPIRILHLTDTHIYAEASRRLLGVDTSETFRQVVELALQTEGSPDLVLLTGDLSDDRSEGSYLRLLKLLEKFDCPIYFLAGNHDSVEELWNQFTAYKGKTGVVSDRSFVVGSWFVTLLNSVLPEKIEGALSKDELERLDKELGEHADNHAFVCVHHNVVPIMPDPEADLGLKNADKLLEIIDRHDNVRGLLWGHVHAEYAGQHKGVQLLASPSTCIQFRVEEEQMVIDPLPPGYRMIYLEEDGALRTALNWLDKLPEGLQV